MINAIVDDVCAVFCRFLRESSTQQGQPVPDEAVIVNHFPDKDIDFDWGRLLRDIHRLNYHEAPPTAFQRGTVFTHSRVPLNTCQTLKNLFEIVTTLVFRWVAESSACPPVPQVPVCREAGQ